MVSLLGLTPLLLAFTALGVLLLAGVSRRVDRRLTRIALALFSRYVDEERLERKRVLQSAYVAETYRGYAAKTYLYTALLSLAGAIVGVYVISGLLFAIPAIGEAISVLPRTIVAAFGRPSKWSVVLSQWQLLLVLGVAGTLGGLVIGLGTFVLRWRLPEGRAEARRRRINESLARTVAFLYALSRGGMPFPEVMRTLARNRRVYGGTAEELSVAVREMDLFGTDMINAIRRMTQRTPSEDFKTFGENLASVLQSGQSLPRFLHDQYDRYQEEAEERQEEILELLATIAEAYVTILVAGSLFLITILLVFGLTTSDTLWIIQLLGYLMIPLANFGFMVYLDQRLELLGIGREGEAAKPEATDTIERSGTDTPAVPAADGGHVASMQANFERLAVYDRLARVKQVLSQPVRTVLWNPVSLLYVTVPLALVWVAIRFPTTLTGEGMNVRVLDDILIQAALFVLGTFAVVRLVYQRRLDRINAATPEMLERLASLNEAGMSIVESFNRIRGGDLGVLTSEVERIWADISLGANVDEAMYRFGQRVQTTPVTRAVTLLTNAMQASGNIGSVLRIAATQARADLRMRRQRRRQMLTYLVVIYVSFLVFLVIIVAVEEVLVPSLPSNVPTPDNTNRLGVDATQFARLGSVDKAAYTLVFFHTALIQAVLSGFIGGQIGEGTVRDGAKHAAIMLGIAYLVFILLSSPVASVTFSDQVSGGETVTIDSVSLSNGGFVVLHAHNPEGPVVGRSGYLPAGKTTDVEIRLTEPIEEDVDLVAVPHRDTNENRQFDYDGGEVDGIYPPEIDAVATGAEIDYFSGAGDVSPPTSAGSVGPANAGGPAARLAGPTPR